MDNKNTKKFRVKYFHVSHITYEHNFGAKCRVLRVIV
jgi:hypothetical protein